MVSTRSCPPLRTGQLVQPSAFTGAQFNNCSEDLYIGRAYMIPETSLAHLNFLGHPRQKIREKRSS
eukprot:5886384-Amphidinium_carterae.1